MLRPDFNEERSGRLENSEKLTLINLKIWMAKGSNQKNKFCSRG